MTIQTFTWHPDVGSRRAHKPRVRSTKFGDGYETRAAIGINSNPQGWSLKFERTAAEIDAIDAFLSSCGGVDAFEWATPNNETWRFVCREWSVQNEKGYKSLTCEFEQVFEV